jgi:hypothetical protein
MPGVGENTEESAGLARRKILRTADWPGSQPLTGVLGPEKCLEADGSSRRIVDPGARRQAAET